MKRKNDLFEELNIGKEQGFCAPFEIDTGSVKKRVRAKIDSACTERKTVTMRSKKKIALIAAAAALTLGISAFGGKRRCVKLVQLVVIRPRLQVAPDCRRGEKGHRLRCR